ncbi:GNAT family N-acetyltransferase [Rhizobium sp.]|jgi:uncharacterized protein|uniref:GNAT family N-acetyltransferase n=1 Tax=Rhizobium sp. TaxID=391 RepID=UPI002AA719F7
MNPPMRERMPEALQHAEGAFRGAVVSSITQIGRDAWTACFAHEPEGYDYLLTVESAGLAGFEWFYATVYQGDLLVAAMPGFLSQYPLDTTLEAGGLRTLIGKIRRVWSGFLTLSLACLGSPCTEAGSIGIHPEIVDDQYALVFETLLSAFETYARHRKCAMTALKDIPQTTFSAFTDTINKRGYTGLDGMPTAWLPIDFDNIETYFTRLSAATRKDMRRKLRTREKVRVEHWHNYGTLLPRIMEFYQATRARSEWQFEELTTAYFTGILESMPETAFCTMYFVEDELLAANLMVRDGHMLIDKFFCMDEAKGRPYNLYYLSWFENIQYCLDHGLSRYQSGQAHYANKLRLGSQLTANAMYFRHSNGLVQKALQAIAPYLSPDDSGDHRS